jgi:hypothetical protein
VADPIDVLSKATVPEDENRPASVSSQPRYEPSLSRLAPNTPTHLGARIVRDKYLLPCSCGKKIPVETTMAGQSIQCSCGRTLDVPKLQGIRRLERFVETSDTPRKTSSRAGRALGIVLIGLIILAAGATHVWWTHSWRPVLPELNLAPWEMWLIWQRDLRQGVRYPEYVESPYMQDMKVYRMYLTFGYVIMGLGIVTIASGAVVALTGRRPDRRPAPRGTP